LITVTLWEKKVKICLNDEDDSEDSKPALSRIEKLVEESKNLDAIPPSRERLFNILQKVSAWREEASSLLKQTDVSPFCEQIERAIDEAKKVEVDLEEVAQLKMVANRVSSWREEVHRLFLGDCQAFSLLEVLMPRKNLQRVCKYKNKDDKPAPLSDYIDFLTTIDISTKDRIDIGRIVTSFQAAEKREFELVRALRVKNTYKRKQKDATFCIL
jgi:hypothetical protein